MRKLGEIRGDLLKLDDVLNETGGEIDAPLEEWLAGLKKEEGDKIDSYLHLMWKWEAEAAAAKKLADLYAGVAKYRAAGAAKMVRGMLRHMTETNQPRLQSATGVPLAIVGVGGTRALKFADDVAVDKLPDSFVKVVREIDGAAVRAAIIADEAKPKEERKPLGWAWLDPLGVRLKIG